MVASHCAEGFQGHLDDYKWYERWCNLTCAKRVGTTLPIPHLNINQHNSTTLSREMLNAILPLLEADGRLFAMATVHASNHTPCSNYACWDADNGGVLLPPTVPAPAM